MTLFAHLVFNLARAPYTWINRMRFWFVLIIGVMASTLMACKTPPPEREKPRKYALPKNPKPKKKPSKPWAACQPGVKIATGTVLDCHDRVLILSDWQKGTKVRLEKRLHREFAAKKMKFKPRKYTFKDATVLDITHYEQVKPERFGIVTVFEHKKKVRTINCVVLDTRVLAQCKADFHALALKKARQLPEKLRAPVATKPKPLEPKIGDSVLTVPTDCRWYQRQILCGKSTFLMWYNVEKKAKPDFEVEFLNTVKTSLKNKATKVDETLGKCKILGQQKSCIQWQAHHREDKHSTVFGVFLKHQNERWVVMCYEPGLKAQTANVCRQLITLSLIHI